MIRSWEPFARYYRRKSAGIVFRKMRSIRLRQPLISFTFDDFPRSALVNGGDILRKFDLAGTYYTALGLMGKDSPSGPICELEDLRRALDEGHELGCHTFNHLDSWETAPQIYADSVKRNQDTLSGLLPEAEFESFAYPLSTPHPMIKRAVSSRFQCCRGGGQRANIGSMDLNQLSAFFLEKAQGDMEPVRKLVDHSRIAGGWIIFATHEVAERTSSYGCTPVFFNDVVRYCVESGARILPVVRALQAIQDEETASRAPFYKKAVC